VIGVHLVGDLLLLETHTWLDACGAFPEDLHDTVAFRLSTWRRVDLDATRRRSAREVLASARAALGPASEPTHLGSGNPTAPGRHRKALRRLRRHRHALLG
jgi:hypothetical protein